MSEPVLFIGGSADGQRREVEDARPTLAVPVRCPFTQDEYAVNHDIYTREFIMGKYGKQYTVYVHRSMAVDCVVGKLIEGYTSMKAVQNDG